MKLKVGATILCLFLMAGCEQQGLGIPDSQKPTAKNATSRRIEQKPAYNQTSDITKEDILSSFNVVKGEITASAAAKKIADSSMSFFSNLTFEQKRVIAYNDEEGTFIIKFKGRKNGAAFDKTFSFSGFTHPYADYPFSMLASDNEKYKLNFDEAIEKNLTLDAYLKKANENTEAYLKNLSFLLSNNRKIVLGNHDSYCLTATLEKLDNQIKIKPAYTVFFSIYEGTAKTRSEKTNFSVFTKFNLKTAYFSDKDVFAYIITQIDENFIQVYENRFASEFYAFAKGLKKTPGNLLNITQIQKYTDLYSQPGGHLELEIDAAINNSTGSGIYADDYAGTLSADCYISTKEKIADGSGAVKENSRTIHKTGFKKMDEKTAKDFFGFTVVMLHYKEHAQSWLDRSFDEYPFVRLNGTESGYVLNNPLKKANTRGEQNPYFLDMGNRTPEEVFPADLPICLVEGSNGNKVFVKGITLDKKSGEAELKINCMFEGAKESISVVVQPFLGHPD